MVRRNKKKMKSLGRKLVDTDKKADPKTLYKYNIIKTYSNGDVVKISNYRLKVRNPDGTTWKSPEGKPKEVTGITLARAKEREKTFLIKEAQREEFGLRNQADLDKKLDLSVLGLFNDWLFDGSANEKIAQKTRKKRKTQMRNHVLKSLGNEKVRDIQEYQMQSFFKDLGELKKKTEVHKVLKPFFDYAISERIIHNNPIPDSVLIDIQAVNRRANIERGDYQREPFVIEDFLMFFDKLKRYRKGKYYLHYLSFGIMGLRISEAFGINWKNIDLKENTIFIKDKVNTRDVKDDKGTRFESDTHLVIDTHLKSVSSIRTIPIPDAVRKQLLFIDPLEQEGLVFRNRNRNILGMKTFHEHHHSKVKRDLDMNWTPHTFRHFFGSYCVGHLGMNPYVVTKLMGHSSLKITEEHYLHEIKAWNINPVRDVVDHFGHFGKEGEIISVNKKDDDYFKSVGV